MKLSNSDLKENGVIQKKQVITYLNTAPIISLISLNRNSYSYYNQPKDLLEFKRVTIINKTLQYSLLIIVHLWLKLLLVTNSKIDKPKKIILVLKNLNQY